MAERYPGDGAVVNVFGRHWIHPWEAQALYEAGYPCPPDTHVPGAWRLSQMGLSVPPVPTGEDRMAEIEAARERMTPEQRPKREHEHKQEEKERIVLLRAEEERYLASIARRRARAACAEPDVIVLDDDNDEAGPSHQYRGGNEDGCSSSAPKKEDGGDDDSDDGGDYTQLYRHFGMSPF